MKAQVKAVQALALILSACAGAWINSGQCGDPVAPAEARPARDRFGDPLPPGALARMGTAGMSPSVGGSADAGDEATLAGIARRNSATS